MRTFDQWMADYGVSHKHPTNKLIHKICVPLIMFSVIGLIWSIPTPEAFQQISPYMNWATLFVAGCLVFYFLLSKIMFVSMVIMTAVMVVLSHQLHQAGTLLQVSIGIFVLAWIAQFYGHKVEGKKPSFMQDLTFLLIGPLWVMRSFYAQIGIKV